jgi:hypothetical protein
MDYFEVLCEYSVCSKTDVSESVFFFNQVEKFRELSYQE